MCLVVFAGSQVALPLIAWNEAAPGFHVHEAKADERARALLRTPFVYELGSHEGCGCGYSPNFGDSAEQRAARDKSRAALVDYVTAALAAGPIRLFAGWNGQSPRRPIDGMVYPAALALPEFWEEIHLGAVTQNDAYRWAVVADTPAQAPD